MMLYRNSKKENQKILGIRQHRVQISRLREETQRRKEIFCNESKRICQRVI